MVTVISSFNTQNPNHQKAVDTLDAFVSAVTETLNQFIPDGQKVLTRAARGYQAALYQRSVSLRENGCDVFGNTDDAREELLATFQAAGSPNIGEALAREIDRLAIKHLEATGISVR